MAIHRYGARQLDAVEHHRAARARERAARRDPLVVELDRLRPGVAHLLEHVEHRDRLDRPVGLRERDDHPGPLGRQPTREDPLRLGTAPQGVQRGLAAVRAGEQVVPLSCEVGRLARERVPAVRGLVEDADQVALPHPGEVRLARLPDLRDQREAEDRAQDAGQDLRPGGPRLAAPGRAPPSRSAARRSGLADGRVALRRPGGSSRRSGLGCLGASGSAGATSGASNIRTSCGTGSARRSLVGTAELDVVGLGSSGTTGGSEFGSSSGRPVAASCLVGLVLGTTGGSEFDLVALGLVRHDRRQRVRRRRLVRHDRGRERFVGLVVRHDRRQRVRLVGGQPGVLLLRAVLWLVHRHALNR